MKQLQDTFSRTYFDVNVSIIFIMRAPFIESAYVRIHKMTLRLVTYTTTHYSSVWVIKCNFQNALCFWWLWQF